MAEKIYGIDPDKPITPIEVRDAIVECFHQAHCLNSDLEIPKEKISKEYCRSIIERTFSEAGGDFEKPTKESLIKTIDRLAKFSESFRDNAVIRKHYGEIMVLINKL